MANRTLKVGSYRIQLVDKPKLTAPVRTIADLKPGMLVKVEGTYQKGAGFLAGKVNDESDVVSRKPGIENRLRVQGKIERVEYGSFGWGSNWGSSVLRNGGLST